MESGRIERLTPLDSLDRNEENLSHPKHSWETAIVHRSLNSGGTLWCCWPCRTLHHFSRRSRKPQTLGVSLSRLAASAPRWWSQSCSAEKTSGRIGIAELCRVNCQTLRFRTDPLKIVQIGTGNSSGSRTEEMMNKSTRDKVLLHSPTSLPRSVRNRTVQSFL